MRIDRVKVNKEKLKGRDPELWTCTRCYWLSGFSGDCNGMSTHLPSTGCPECGGHDYDKIKDLKGLKKKPEEDEGMSEYLMRVECWVLAKTAMDAEELVRKNLGNRTVDSVAIAKSKPVTSVSVDSPYMPKEGEGLLCATCHYRPPIKDASQCEPCRVECRKQGAVYPADHEGPTKDFVDTRELDQAQEAYASLKRQHDELVEEFKGMETERNKYRSELVDAAHYLSIGQKETVEKTGVADAIHARLIKVNPLSDAQLQVAIDALEKKGYTVLLPFDEEDARLAGCKPSVYPPPVKHMEYLDKTIEYWRENRDKAVTGETKDKCACYIDAFQSARSAFSGKVKPPEERYYCNSCGHTTTNKFDPCPECNCQVFYPCGSMKRSLDIAEAHDVCVGISDVQKEPVLKVVNPKGGETVKWPTPGRWFVENDDSFNRSRDIWRILSSDTMKRWEEHKTSARTPYLATVYSRADADYICQLHNVRESAKRMVKAHDGTLEKLADEPDPINRRTLEEWEPFVLGLLATLDQDHKAKRVVRDLYGDLVHTTKMLQERKEPSSASNELELFREAVDRLRIVALGAFNLLKDEQDPYDQGKREVWANVEQKLAAVLKGHRPYVPKCGACSIEADIGTEEVPHPIDRRLHTCVEQEDESLERSHRIAEEHDVCVGIDNSKRCAAGEHEPDLELEQRMHGSATYDHHDCLTYYSEGGKNIDEMKVILKQHICKHCRAFYGEPADELYNREEPDEDRKEGGSESD